MSEDRRTLALLLGATAALAGACGLLIAWAFGCASSDAIRNCSSNAEVAAWWGLPAAGLVFGAPSYWAALRRRGPLFAALWVPSAAALGGWWFGLVVP